MFAHAADTVQDQAEGLKKMSCYNCGKLGHLKRNCPLLSKEQASAASSLLPRREQALPKPAICIGGSAHNMLHNNMRKLINVTYPKYSHRIWPGMTNGLETKCP
mmetsp:Transcript_15819/g.39755  ORF Transcript_15819/g.39755 Transcript_15819/m.39755 type:complete len:104 (-) Transcript_15819:52-363(-)